MITETIYYPNCDNIGVDVSLKDNHITIIQITNSSYDYSDKISATNISYNNKFNCFRIKNNDGIHDDKWGIIELNYKLVIPPTKYDFISLFFNNLSVIKINEKYGLINIKGEEVTEIIYDEFITQNGKIIETSKNGLKYVFNHLGELKSHRELKINKIIRKKL